MRTTTWSRLICVFVLILLGGSGTAARAQSPVPFVNLPLVPSSIPPGGPSFTLTVNGTGFVAGSVVNWNGAPLATTFVSSSQLTATVPSAEIAAAGTAEITVSTPPAGGGKSRAAYFHVTNPAANPISFAKNDYSADLGAIAVATGDFNKDGKLDLAAANIDSNNVSILQGNGDGTFQPAVNYAVADLPLHIAVEDFNGDGKLDLAVTCGFGNVVDILLGSGDGAFQPAVPNGVPALYPDWTAVGDLDGDGKPDLVVSLIFGGVAIMLGNGDGTFRYAGRYPTADYPTSVTLGDFNGDARLDIAVGNNAGGNSGAGLSMLLGNGDGTFQCGPTESTSTPQSLSACAFLVNSPVVTGMGVTAADFTGDGKLDLAIPNGAVGYGANNVAILAGNGDGTFQVTYYTAGQAPIALVPGDLVGDGKLALAVVNIHADDVSLLLGNGNGTFQAAENFEGFNFNNGSGLNPLGAGPGSIAAGDFNGDGRLDLVVANANDVSVLLQVGQQSSTTMTLFSSGNPSVFHQNVTFAATVSSAGGTPEGTVTFMDGSTVLGETTLELEQAVISTPALSLGSHSITARYGGNSNFGASSASLTQDVGYGICALYGQTKSVKSGAVYPIKLLLCDAGGNDVSSSAIVIHATRVTAVSGYSGDPETVGNANPDSDFRFDSTLGPSGGYIINLDTKGLASGTYSLQFTAGSDPVPHSATFGVK